MGKYWPFLGVQPVHGKCSTQCRQVARAPSTSRRFYPHFTDWGIMVESGGAGAAGRHGALQGGPRQTEMRSLRMVLKALETQHCQRLVPASLLSF